MQMRVVFPICIFPVSVKVVQSPHLYDSEAIVSEWLFWVGFVFVFGNVWFFCSVLSAFLTCFGGWFYSVFLVSEVG